MTLTPGVVAVGAAVGAVMGAVGAVGAPLVARPVAAVGKGINSSPELWFDPTRGVEAVAVALVRFGRGTATSDSTALFLRLWISPRRGVEAITNSVLGCASSTTGG